MSSNRKITPTSGKSGYIDSGDLNSYQDIVTKRTQQDMINEGKEFKRSIYKTPWGVGVDYQGMEFMGSSMSFQPIDILLNINPNGIPDNFEIPDLGEGTEKAPCDCLDCMNLPTILSEVCCDGFSKVPVGFFVIGKLRGKASVDESSGDSIDLIQAQILPVPDSCNEKSIPCYTNIYTLWIDCSGTWVERQANLNICSKDFPINIKKSCGSCSTLTIVDQDGTPATDTILTTGSNDYSYTGTCIGAVTWSVAAASGSTLGSAAITSSGILTATGACGTLIITATCAGCGTSATQDVRVTNSGSWSSISTCSPNGYCGTTHGTSDVYEGRYWYHVTWYCVVQPGALQPPPGLCPCGSCTPPSYSCPGSPPDCGGGYNYQVRSVVTYEWKGTGGCI